MEGTSGAAERALLRGRAGEAALSFESSRQWAPGRAGARASGQRGGFVAGGQTNSRRRRRLRAAVRHEPATGGVRADRVGAKRSPRAVAVDGAIERQKNLLLRRPLTRETSTGRPAKVGAAIRSPTTRRKARPGDGAVRLPSGGFGGASPRARGPGRKPRALRVGSKAAPAGDRRCGTVEFGRPWSCSQVVSVAEVDRRREAALAHARRARGQRGTV